MTWPSVQYASGLLAVRIARAQAAVPVRELARAA